MTTGLTIGQLAAHAGVTIKAVRHYHRLGLLAEPERDDSGYRRYGPAAVVGLIRIKTLADAGVPLARVQELLRAEPAQFAEAIAQIDRDLADKARELARRRRRIADLAAGDQLFLPPEVVGILDRMRAMGVSERTVGIERDVWIMITAQSPDSLPAWVAEKNAGLDDPELREIFLACDQAAGWDPDDQRLLGLADAIRAWDARQTKNATAPAGTLAVTAAHILGSSRSWQRLLHLVQARQQGGAEQAPPPREPG